LVVLEWWCGWKKDVDGMWRRNQKKIMKERTFSFEPTILCCEQRACARASDLLHLLHLIGTERTQHHCLSAHAEQQNLADHTTSASHCITFWNKSAHAEQQQYYRDGACDTMQKPMILYVDNNGANDLVDNWSIGGRTRHVEVRQYFLRELKEQGLISSVWTARIGMCGDLLTKNLPWQI
jgi:hypothetical protein